MSGRNGNPTHGHSARPDGKNIADPTYKSWAKMRRRCLDPKSDQYRYYGGRGITISKGWDDFAIFLADMGPRPTGRTLDRIDRNGPYSPTNCQWATKHQQVRNKSDNLRFDWNGQSLCLAEICALTNAPYDRTWKRLRRGWSIERATQ